MNRIERITLMEEKYDRILAVVNQLDEALEKFEAVFPEMEKLLEYYQSVLWRKDFEADEKGKLPQDLKRGVLSEDGIYNLLTDYQRLKELIESKGK